MSTITAPDRDRLAASSDEVKRTVEIVWSAYRSVLSKEGRLAYVSTAITSGKLMWNTVFELGLKSPDEIKAVRPELLMLAIIKPNIEAGNSLARQIAARIDYPVVAPAIFEGRPQRWSQDEYMALWLKMIEDNVGQIYMAPGWEFSNGGAEEYLHAVQMACGFRSRGDIEPLSHDGKLLTLSTGIDLVGRALLWIHERGGKAQTLAETYRSLATIYGAFHTIGVHNDLPRCVNWSLLDGRPQTLSDCRRLLALDYGLEETVVVGERGVPRAKDVTPEGIILKTEPPVNA